jgi:hypothetical protein
MATLVPNLPLCQLTWVKEAATQIPEEERGRHRLGRAQQRGRSAGGTLAAYAEDNGFPFIFAVMPAEMLQAMADDLGQEIAVPPATPHLIVAADGTIGELHTGSASPEDLLALLAEAQQRSRRVVNAYLGAFLLGNAAILGNVCLLRSTRV